MTDFINEKVQQAVQILREFKCDVWLTFVRETSTGSDPVLPLIYGQDLTWNSALIITASGETIAIVGRYEAEAARCTRAYTTVLPYDQSIQALLLETLTRLDPHKIAINYSLNDVNADGLTYGMHQLLVRYLSDTPLLKRVISAESLIAALRSRKLLCEIQWIREAVEVTQKIFLNTFSYLQPGITEKQVANYMHSQLKIFGVGPAWNIDNCPAINSGPDSPIGHCGPTDIRIEPGHLVHIDFGIKKNNYCSDIQRVGYFYRSGETRPPDIIQRGFDTVVQAIQKTVSAIKPGMRGVEIDEIARQAITGAGYPEYLYATGHQLGRAAHDGAGILGPPWERYGETPNYLIETGHVYTIEPGIHIPGHGYIGLEEDILVTNNGAVFLGTPQTEIIMY